MDKDSCKYNLESALLGLENRGIYNLDYPDILLDCTQIEQFALYYRLLVEYNQKFNLTAITEEKEVYSKHFYDSLLPLKDRKITGKVADIGSGAGFPGLPLKICNPDISLFIVDPLKKRMEFLKVVVKELGLQDVHIYPERAEDFAWDHREYFDFVAARAVAKFDILAELCLPLVKVGGEFIAYKGSDSEEETNNSKKALSLLGGKAIEVTFHGYPGGTRTFIYTKKIRPTPKKFPRPYNQIKKQPL